MDKLDVSVSKGVFGGHLLGIVTIKKTSATESTNQVMVTTCVHLQWSTEFRQD